MLDVAEVLLGAVRHHRAGRRAESAALCRRVLEADPDQPNALFLSGLLALDEGRPSAAAADFARAVAADLGHQGARINLARAFLSAGDPASALEAAETGLAGFPDAAELHFVRGTAFGTLRRPEQAGASLARAIALDPSHACAWLNLGNA